MLCPNVLEHLGGTKNASTSNSQQSFINWWTKRVNKMCCQCSCHCKATFTDTCHITKSAVWCVGYCTVHQLTLRTACAAEGAMSHWDILRSDDMPSVERHKRIWSVICDGTFCDARMNQTISVHDEGMQPIARICARKLLSIMDP